MKLPDIRPEDTVIVADPMLASGPTMVSVLEEVFKASSPKRVIIASVIAASLGMERVMKHYPQVELFVVSIDEGLNEHGYVLPGLGDTGDELSAKHFLHHKFPHLLLKRCTRFQDASESL